MRISDWSSDVCSSDLADIAALSHDLQTLRDKGTVQSAKGGDVGNRTECNQVQQINEARFGTLVKIAAPTQFTEQCRAQQESDANCRQVPMRYAHIAFVKPVGVDQCMGDRKDRKSTRLNSSH